MTEISYGQQFVAFEKSVQGSDVWYDIYLPCGNSNICTGWIAGIYGGTTYSVEAPSMTQVEVTGTGSSGLNIRAYPGGSVIDGAWDSQRFVTFANQPSGSGCGSNWYEIYLPLVSGAATGWMCGDYLILGAGADPLDGTWVGSIVGVNVPLIPFTFVLDQSGQIVSGSYDAGGISYGSVSGTLVNNIFTFTLTEQVPTCPGNSYNGNATLSGNVLTINNLDGLFCNSFPVSGVTGTLTRQASTDDLSGTISTAGAAGLSGVSVSLVGGIAQSTSSYANGFYSFAGVPDDSYTITPSLAGYVFTPVLRTVTMSGVNRTGLDFRACQTSVPLSGYLRDATTGSPLSGVTVTANGVSATTDSNGYYEIPGLTCGPQAVTVNVPGYAGYDYTMDSFDSWNLDIQLTKESTTNGFNNNSGFAADPVNTATGNYTYSHKDLSIPGKGIPFVFMRGYNSRDDSNGPLGYNWTHNYNTSLSVDGSGNVTIRWGDGRTETWAPDGMGGFTPMYGVFDTLIDNGDGTYSLKKKSRTIYNFNTTNQLASIVDKNGNTISLTYTSGNLTQVTDTAGRNINFTYDASNRITQITDPISRSVQFTYDVNGDLVTATDPNGNATTYTYDASHQILTIVAPLGNTVVSNTYDAANRVVTYQSDAKGGATSYVYQALDRTTTITDALGNVTVHYHDSMLRLIKEEDANGGIALYVYDTAGNRTKVTDNNGNLTQYGYDAGGNVINKTDALGNVTTITYDANNNPLTRTDALLNTTNFTYDANGNLTSTQDALLNTTSVTYDGSGLPLTVTDARGNITTNAYDVQGNLVQVQDALGNITQYTYDGVGRRLTKLDALSRTTAYTYDSNDNLLSVTDPALNTVTYTYDGNNNKLTATDKNGNLTQYVYDEKDLLTTTTDALLGVVTNTYDALDRRIAVQDKNGNTAGYAYDPVGNLTQVTDPLLHATQYTYDANGNRLSTTDPNSHTTTYIYDTLNRRITEKDALGNTTTTAYDKLGRVVTVSHPDGSSTSSAYDAAGRLIQVMAADGGTIQYAYDAAGNRTSMTDPNGNTTTYTYDALNRKIRETDVHSQFISTSYDAMGNIADVTDQNGYTTQYTYDALDRKITKTDPLGNTTQHTYDPNGNRLSRTDGNGNTTTYTYDALNRLIKIQDPDGFFISNAYDALGRKISTTDKIGNATTFNYDAAGNLFQVTDALGQVTDYTYDANGNRLTSTDPLGHTRSYTYDALNRKITESDPLGNTTTLAYDVMGRIASVTNAKGQVTSYTYDPVGRLTRVTDAEGGVVDYAYDLVGNRISRAGPNPSVTTYVYDELNRMVSKTEALGNTTIYEYDPVGNVDRLTNPNGDIIQYGYDPLNRLGMISYPDASTVYYEYDATGNRTRMTDTLGISTYAYDTLNRMVSFTDPFGKTVTYGYDLNGNRQNITYPDGKVVEYGYDALNRLISVTDWLLHMTGYSYDAAGRLTNTTNPNGTTAAYSYDNADRLTALTNAKSDATVISSYNYTLDPIGNHEHVTRNEPLAPVIPDTSIAYTHDSEDRLTDVNGTPNTFDNNGNMLSEGVDSFAYDYEDRLVQSVIGGTATQYQYDGAGHRLVRDEGGTITRFVLDINTSLTNVLAETDNTGTTTAYYVYGLGLISKVLPDGTASYYHYDSRGSTIALTDSLENMTDTYAYDPFGKLMNSTGTTANPFKYIGRHGVMDEGDGLNYIRARYYDNEQQRFISKDPKAGNDKDGQSLNRYVYGLNNPIVLIDPSGLFSWKAAGFGLLQIASGVGEIAQFTLKTASAGMTGPIAGPIRIIAAINDINDSSKYFSAAWENIFHGDDDWVTKDDFVSPIDTVLENNKPLKVMNDAALVANFAIGVSGLLKAPDKIADSVDYMSKFGSQGAIGQFADFQFSTTVLNVIEKSVKFLSDDSADLNAFGGDISEMGIGKNIPILQEIIEVRSYGRKKFKK